MSSDAERVTHYRPSAYPCGSCGASPEEQDLVRGPTGYVWRCSRCNTQTSEVLPFDPKRAPHGRSDIMLAIETLAVYVPILQPIDDELVYRIVRPYFEAGWCVRDVIYAINYLPNGDTHPGQGASWVRGEHWDRTLWRLQHRLRSWRFADKENGQDIMHGPYTAILTAMRQAADSQRQRAVTRANEWREREEVARHAEAGDVRGMARRQAVIAASLARQMRSRAEQKEREIQGLEFERSRAASTVRIEQYRENAGPDS